MRNSIYYLYDLQCTCSELIMYDDLHEPYFRLVNTNLNKYFSIIEQKQLKLHDFNKFIFNKFAYSNIPEDISFDNIDPIKLNNFFENITYIDKKDLTGI